MTILSAVAVDEGGTMIGIIGLLLQLGGMPSCPPPCDLLVITTMPAQLECQCPPELKSIGEPIPIDQDVDGTAEFYYDDPGMKPWLWSPAPKNDEVVWEVKQMGEWLCIRQPNRKD